MSLGVSQAAGEVENQHAVVVIGRRQLLGRYGLDIALIAEIHLRHMGAGDRVACRGRVVQHIGLPAHLAQPGGGGQGPRPGIVDADHARAEGGHEGVRLLHQLHADGRLGARQVAGGVFLAGAHVVDIERARRRLGPEGVEGFGIDDFDPGALGHPAGAGQGEGEALGPDLGRSALVAGLHLMAGQLPAHGAVLQRHDRIG